MALSNWATMAFNMEGSHSDGSLTSFKGLNADIYKNWLYLRHNKMWVEGGGFAEPTIAEIQHGELTIHDMRILAGRWHQQNAIFVYVESNKEKQVRWMAGIGCYGFQGEDWVGVTPETSEAFFGWLEEVVKEFTLVPKKDWVDKCRAYEGRHFNQGDAYFEEQGLGEKPMLKPGEATEPALMQIIKHM